MKFSKIFLLSTLILIAGAFLPYNDLMGYENVADSPSAAPSHQIWDGLLKKYVTSSGKVNYKGLKNEEAKLDQYIALLAKATPQSSWGRNASMAYWINAYNAFTVKLILENYPLGSITKLDKPWDTKFIKLAGASYSLNQIENQIIRPTYKDARIHFAVNCAAKSCPKLLNEAFTASKLNSQLEKQSRAFVNNMVANSLSKDAVQISKIFDWYKDDFTSNGGVVAFLKKYSTKEISDQAAVSYRAYNWNLNE
ncbi:MAG: DUF547 domain-containing protein [Bacteroidota bacterium]